MYIKKTQHTVKGICPVRQKTLSQEMVGMPVRKIVFKEEVEELNSYTHLSKQPKYNPDALEIAISTGQPLDEVNSLVLSPDRLDINIQDSSVDNDDNNETNNVN